MPTPRIPAPRATKGVLSRGTASQKRIGARLALGIKSVALAQALFLTLKGLFD
jgi:hypothetical protein